MRRLRSRNHPSDALAAMSLLFLAGPLTARSLGDASTTMPQGRGPIAVELSRRPGSRELAGAMPAPSRRHRALGDDGGANPAGVVGVVDCENAEYSGLIGLGTPVQEFEVVLDTGSYSLWVTGVACKEDCESNNKYDSSLSSTYVADGTVLSQAYEDGSSAQGILSIDTLSLGGLTTTATFGEMSKRALHGCLTVDGIMGMGLSSSGDEQNIFEDLVDAGVVEVPIFSFFIGNIDTDSPTGVLTLGGVNQTHYEGCLQWVDVAEDAVRDGYWSISLRDVKIGSESVLRSPASAILDTGSSMIVGPYEDVGFLADSIGAFCVAFETTSSSTPYQVDCRNEPRKIELIMMSCDSEFDDINFYFGGDDFALTPAELLLPLTDFGPVNPTTSQDPYCLFGMMGHDERMWILGDSFLRTFYTAYDVGERRVGLAKATGHREGDACPSDDSIAGVAINGGQDGTGSAPPADDSSAVSSVDPTSPPTPASLPAPESSVAPAAADTSAEGGGGSSSGTKPEEGSDDDGTSGSGSEPGEGDNNDNGSQDDASTQHGASSSSSHAESEEGENPPSLAAVAAAASLGTLITLAACGGVAVLVHRRIRRGQTHRHIKLGAPGHANGLELSSSKGAGNGAVVGAEDDFLQARPGGYRGSGSGSHRYRVATESVTDGSSSAVTVLGSAQDDYDEEEDDDVVEVDFGVSNEVDAGSAGTPLGRLGRMLGRGRAGFTAFENREDSVADQL